MLLSNLARACRSWSRLNNLRRGSQLLEEWHISERLLARPGGSVVTRPGGSARVARPVWLGGDSADQLAQTPSSFRSATCTRARHWRGVAATYEALVASAAAADDANLCCNFLSVSMKCLC